MGVSQYEEQTPLGALFPIGLLLEGSPTILRHGWFWLRQKRHLSFVQCIFMGRITFVSLMQQTEKEAKPKLRHTRLLSSAHVRTHWPQTSRMFNHGHSQRWILFEVWAMA